MECHPDIEPEEKLVRDPTCTMKAELIVDGMSSRHCTRREAGKRSNVHNEGRFNC